MNANIDLIMQFVLDSKCKEECIGFTMMLLKYNHYVFLKFYF